MKIGERSHTAHLTLDRWVITMVVLAGGALFVMIGCLQVGVQHIGFADAGRILFRAVSEWHARCY